MPPPPLAARATGAGTRTGETARHANRDEKEQINPFAVPIYYFSVGMTYSAPVRIPEGQREVTYFALV